MAVRYSRAVAGPFNFTPAEQRLLPYLLKGTDARTIARDLGITFHSVTSMRPRVLEKYNLKVLLESEPLHKGHGATTLGRARKGRRSTLVYPQIGKWKNPSDFK